MPTKLASSNLLNQLEYLRLCVWLTVEKADVRIIVEETPINTCQDFQFVNRIINKLTTKQYRSNKRSNMSAQSNPAVDPVNTLKGLFPNVAESLISDVVVQSGGDIETGAHRLLELQMQQVRFFCVAFT